MKIKWDAEMERKAKAGWAEFAYLLPYIRAAEERAARARARIRKVGRAAAVYAARSK